MTAEEYWDGDNRLCKAYREADKYRRQRKNNEDYRLGAYFYHALADVSPLFRFSTKKSIKADPYLSEPFPIDEDEKEDKEIERHDDEMRKLLEKLKAEAKQAREIRAKAEAVQDNGR